MLKMCEILEIKLCPLSFNWLLQSYRDTGINDKRIAEQRKFISSCMFFHWGDEKCIEIFIANPKISNVGDLDCEPGSSVSVVSGYGLDDRAIEVRSQAEAKGLSRPALGPIQPPVQWVPGVVSPVLKRGRGVTLTTHPYRVPRSLMSRSYTSSRLEGLRRM
jgi:hypothetical protein